MSTRTLSPTTEPATEAEGVPSKSYAPMIRRYLLSALGILAIIGYWELHVRLFKVPEFLIPAPSVVARSMVDE
jgi:ABC-type nitrate/sulfonate/bicarbonate transport system permease component